MLSNTASEPSGVAETVFGYLRAQGDTDYIGEAVSQLEHSLQAAAMAVEAGSEDELVLAALLHDIGRFLPQSAKLPRMLAPDGTYIGTASHESVGERFLREVGFPGRVCAVVGAHVWAKRYLCATEEGYWEALSKSSKASLVHQVCWVDLSIESSCGRPSDEESMCRGDPSHLNRWKRPKGRTL